MDMSGRPSRLRRPGRAMAMVATMTMVLAAVLAACGSSPEASGPPDSPPARPPATTVPTTSTPPTTPGPATTALVPPAVPTEGVYLGAWLHPVAMGHQGSSFAVEQHTVPAVQAVTGRPLAILHLYSAWARPAPVAELADITDNGSVPLLDWACAPDSAAVAGGADDPAIIAYATALKAFGKPVFLRWCWEMNLVRSHPGVGGPIGFVSAWVHIWNLFHQVGATNVAFVWCPALTGVDPAPYYPGDAYVDWIGVDGYDRTGVATFASLFTGFSQQWVGHHKPMMVAETGATAGTQAAYLGSIPSGLSLLPAFKAVVYFDATGPTADWQLAGDGLTAFGALAREPLFIPR
jgi:hypothetical protein